MEDKLNRPVPDFNNRLPAEGGLENLTGPHAAVGEVVTGDDLVLVHLRQHPGLPQVRDEDARTHAQRDPVPVVVNQLPQILLAHLLQVPTLRDDALSCHAGRLSQREN